VVFRSATEPFDTSTPAGRMLVQMLGVFAEFEHEMIIDRVVNGMEREAFKASGPRHRTRGLPRRPRNPTPRTRRGRDALLAGPRRRPTGHRVRWILHAQLGWAPEESTLQRMFVRTGLTALAARPITPAVFGWFEADRPNEIWVGDAFHGIRLEGRKTYLFAFLDDHSRRGRTPAGFAEDTGSASSAKVLHRTRLAANPVAAVRANLTVPSHLPHLILQCPRVHKILHDPELPAVSQPPFDDLVGTLNVGFFLTDTDVLIDEQHSSILNQQTPQHPPELFEPAHRHMGKPAREEDRIKPVIRLP